MWYNSFTPMKRKVIYIFENVHNLDLMLNLRGQGISEKSLSLLFGCDKNAIRYQCRKYGVQPIEKDSNLGGILIEVKKNAKRYDTIEGVRFNRGKSYKEYIRDSVPPSR